MRRGRRESGSGKLVQCVNWSISYSQSVGKLVNQSVNQFASFLCRRASSLVATFSPFPSLSLSALGQSFA